MNDNIVEVKELKKYFERGFKGVLKAVDGVSFSVKRAEVLGLVGESGSGKTTVGRTLLHLYTPTGGEIYFNKKRIESAEDIRFLRQRSAMVFQDPYSSLDPRMTVENIIAEPLDATNKKMQKAERREKILALMEAVGLGREHIYRYPHEFSGGQRQRIGIARALALDPEFIICDEPVSALDVSIQAQIINTFSCLKEKLKLTYLFIAHDLLIVRHISDRIAVMYLGRIVEIGKADDVCSDPIHPYTKALMAAIPYPDPKYKSTPLLIHPTKVSNASKRGCPYYSKCPYSKSNCNDEAPKLLEIEKGRFAACHYAKELY